MMKEIIISLFFNICFTMTHAQLTVERLYTKNRALTEEKREAYYAKTIYFPDSAHIPITVEEIYVSNNNLKLQGTAKDILGNNFFGKKYEYYENGNLKSEIMLTHDSKQIDTALYFHSNGKIKSILYYPFTIDNKEKYTIGSPLYLLHSDTTGKILLKDGNGFVTSEDSDGYEEGNYLNHKKEGEWKGYFHNKKYSFIETFKGNKIISGITKDSIGNEISYDSITYWKEPKYPGGIQNLLKFVSGSFIYPKEAISKNIAGIIEVLFIVDETGRPKDFVIQNDLKYGTANAAMKVVKKMKNWTPGISRGIPVPVEYTLPIRLNAATPTPKNNIFSAY